MLTLNTDLLIGNEDIDGDHQQLVNIINKFKEQSQSGQNSQVMHETLKSLMGYGAKHFEREEAIQKEINFPHRDGHAKEHQSLAAQVADRARDYFVAKTKPLDEQAIQDLNLFLDDWLISHIQKYDVGMREFLQKHPVKSLKQTDNKLHKFHCSDITALVVDDDEIPLKLMERLLQSMGAANVVKAKAGMEALHIIFGDTPPDLVICDLNMDGLDGFAVVGAMRASVKTYINKIPVIIFSASDDSQVMRQAMAVGATAAFPKQFNPLELSKYLCHAVKDINPARTLKSES